MVLSVVSPRGAAAAPVRSTSPGAAASPEPGGGVSFSLIASTGTGPVFGFSFLKFIFKKLLEEHSDAEGTSFLPTNFQWVVYNSAGQLVATGIGQYPPDSYYAAGVIYTGEAAFTVDTKIPPTHGVVRIAYFFLPGRRNADP